MAIILTIGELAPDPNIGWRRPCERPEALLVDKHMLHQLVDGLFGR